jgi:beta-galactosidase
MNRYRNEKRLLHGGDYNPDQWLDRPDILAQDLEFMRLSHTNTFSVGIFAWSALEPEEGKFQFEWLDKIMDDIYAIGGNVILATPSGARPAWLSENYPEVLRTDSNRVKMLHGGRHNHCFTSPIYREKVQIMNRKLAERYHDHPALLMWHISNEFSGECHCDLCQEAFREWLQKKYSTLEELNRVWWTPFWSHTYTNWSQVESPSPIGEGGVHGLNLDWRRFVTDQTIDFYEHETTDLRRLSPDVPITTNFMADTHDLIPFQALDYSKFAKHVDVLSWDCYPAWHNDWDTTATLASKVGFINDLYRGMKQQPFLIMESTPSGVNWHDVNKTKRPGMHLLSSLQLVAHGSDSVMYFQWRKSRGSSEKFHGAVVDHDCSTANRVFKDVTSVGQALEQIASVKGTNKQADAAILFDWENHWALEDAQGYAKETKQYPQTLQEHYRALWELDVPVDVITKENDFAKYKLLIVPMLYMMSKETMRRLQEFTKNGGTVIGSYITGVVDEHDLVYQGAWPEELQEIFGINVLETDTYYPKDHNHLSYGNQIFTINDYCAIIEAKGAQVTGTYEEDFYAGTPAITTNQYGDGKGIFMAPRTEFAFLQHFYKQLVDEVGLVNQWVEVGNPVVSVQERADEEVCYQFVMNFSEESQQIKVKQSGMDLVSGEGTSMEMTLKPYEVKVVKIEK